MCYTENRLKDLIMADVFVVSAVRSPIGTGRAKDSKLAIMTPQKLALQVLGSLFGKVPVVPKDIEVFRLGSVVSLKSESMKQSPAREIALRMNMLNASSNIVEKACSSGLLAVYEAVQTVKFEKANFAIGGGVDLMSNAAEDAVKNALTDPLTGKSMAELSDTKARELGFKREEYDAYALESYARAKKNIFGYAGFITAIFPGSGDASTFNFDQNINLIEMTQEKMAKGKSLPGCEITTPYNSSKYGDGCGMLMLASRPAVKKYKLPVLAKFLSYAEHTAKDPKDFIIAPVGAVHLALEKAKITNRDVGAWWINEAFPGSPLAFMNAWDAVNEGIEYENVNPWGGAIAFGHPLGATGAILAVNAICQARKEKQKYVVVSLCNAIAEATAMVFEIV